MTKTNKLKQCWGPIGAPALLSETLQAPWGQFPSLAQDLFAVRFVASKTSTDLGQLRELRLMIAENGTPA